MSSHVFLIGFMGAGKSTVGRILAQGLDRAFVDSDELVEIASGRSVRDIFSDEGEEGFRDRETASLAALTDWPPLVVACGGGIVLRDENRALLGDYGTVVYLNVTAGEALARVGDDDARPLLVGGGAAMAATLLEARECLYDAVSDITVDTVGRTPDQVAEHVAVLLRERGLE